MSALARAARRWRWRGCITGRPMGGWAAVFTDARVAFSSFEVPVVGVMSLEQAPIFYGFMESLSKIVPADFDEMAALKR